MSCCVTFLGCTPVVACEESPLELAISRQRKTSIGWLGVMHWVEDVRLAGKTAKRGKAQVGS